MIKKPRFVMYGQFFFWNYKFFSLMGDGAESDEVAAQET